MYNVRPVIVPFRHSRYRAGQTELRPLLATHRHNYDNWHIGTHDVYGASTKQQLSKPGVYIAVKKGEKVWGGEYGDLLASKGNITNYMHIITIMCT